MCANARIEATDRATLYDRIESYLARECGILHGGPPLPRLERCDGEAHSNPYIDNCGQCAPRWGWTGPGVIVR